MGAVKNFKEIWKKNKEEVEKERKERKSGGKLQTTALKVIRFIMQCISVYMIVTMATTFFVPYIVSSLAGFAGISYEADIFYIICGWVAPSVFAVGLLFILTIFLIRKTWMFWNRVFMRFWVDSESIEKKS